MVKAVTAVQGERMSYLKAAKTFDVPRQTLYRLAKKGDWEHQKAVSFVLGRKTVLP
jgi:transposase